MKRILEVTAAFVLLSLAAIACLRMGACYNKFVDERGYHEDWADAYSYGWKRGYIARYKRETFARHEAEQQINQFDIVPALHVD